MDLKEQFEPIAKKVMKAQGRLMSLPVDLMAVSVECVSETVHEVQRKAALVVHGENGEGEGGERVPGMKAMAGLGMIPLLEFAKLPRSVWMAGIEKLSESWYAMKQGTGDIMTPEVGGEGQKPISQEPCATEEDEVWAEAEVLTGDVKKGLYQGVLWEIGRPGRSEYDGEWAAVFHYLAGAGDDEINCPRLPNFLAVPGGVPRRGSTEELNIHLVLDRDYQAGILALIYDRWGAERNEVRLDGTLIASVGGAGCGRHRQVAIGLPGVSAGDHVLSVVASGDTEAGGHGIDFLKLLTRDEQI
jgi:hypothetical protein